MAKGSSGGKRGGGEGRERAGGSVNPNNIKNRTDLVSTREGNQEAVDETLSVFQAVYEEYGVTASTIELANFVGKDSNALGCCSGDAITINKSYFSKGGMDSAMKKSVEQGYHPSLGDKTGLQAVVAHEAGHMLTLHLENKLGQGYKETSKRIVDEARKKTGYRGVVQMERAISRYATVNDGEAIAEAFSDVFCNGKKAHKESIAIVDVMNKYLKGGK